MIRELFRSVATHSAPPENPIPFADRTQLTLQLRNLSPALTAEVELRYQRNQIRRAHLYDSYKEIAATLAAHQIDFVLLKGFTHETGFGIDPSARIQYDLDFLIARNQLAEARTALASLNYLPHGDTLSDEHSPPLVRPSTWQWRGDYFDIDMPTPVELHDSLWNPGKDRIPLQGIEAFWTRRTTVNVNGLEIPSLSEPDRLAFAALHALRHILRHDARPAHILELATFLNTRANDASFWTQWRDLYPANLKALQIVAFQFAQAWFNCAWPTTLEEEWSQHPRHFTEPINRWFQNFAWSPAENLLRPNKDTVWLHMALTATTADRVKIVFDRLTPLRLPHNQESAPYPVRLYRRLRYHVSALPHALASGFRWWCRRSTP